MGGNEVLTSHYLVDLLVQPTLETQITVGYNAHQTTFVVHHRDAANVIVGHQSQRIGNSPAATDGHRVIDHTVLGTLHDGHLTGLGLYRHVLMNHTDATLTCNGNGHGRLGNGIHGCRHKGNVQLDVSREAGFQLYCLRQYL